MWLNPQFSADLVTFTKEILNGKLHFLSSVFFSFLLFKHLWKIFHPIHLFFLIWFRYLQTRIKESFMYLSSQLFFKTPNQTLKFQEKTKKNVFSSDLQT